jgi:Holliday junction resolvasome RuvABC endonuclease subunit
VWTYKKRRGDSPGVKWLLFRNWLNAFILYTPTDIIVYEQPHHRGGASTHSGEGFVTVIEQVAAEQNCEVTNRHSATIKKFATGDGRASKADMLKAAQKWGRPKDDNEADAICLLHLFLSEVQNEAKAAGD